MKFNLIISDPPWKFGDRLDKMKATRKRGAHAHYSEMTAAEIALIDVPAVVEDDALLVLWTPGTHLFEAKKVIDSWGFTYKQNAVWTKVLPEAEKRLREDEEKKLGGVLKMGMGRLFRQCHETVLLATKGNVYPLLKNKGQRSVMFAENKGHSSKPECLQDSLEKMFPEARKLEMFARRRREGWTCIGDEMDGLEINRAIKILSETVDVPSFTTSAPEKENGIYIVDSGPWTRSTDGDLVLKIAAQKVLRAPQEDGIILL